jgi:hypothetical protein
LIFLGNNSGLVRETLCRRPWWNTAIEDEDSRGTIGLMQGTTAYGAARIDYAKHREFAEESLFSGRFDFCWRPTLGLRVLDGIPVTIHTAMNANAINSAPRQLLNHLPAVKCIASKTGLYRSIACYYDRLGVDLSANVPTTFILRDVLKKGMPEFMRFCAHFRHLSEGNLAAAGERMPAKHCRKNMWYVLPNMALTDMCVRA